MTAIQLDSGWLEACLALDATALGGFWSSAQWLKELEDDRRICLGLVTGEVLIGVACGWLVLDELHITLLAVDPSHRRKGNGQLLLLCLLRLARQNGAIHATLEVAPDNTAAIDLYARCGFRSAGCRKGYYRDGRDALIQWRQLVESNTI